MSTKFTLFPQLTTELRLEIWRLALDELPRRLLYPFREGCWVMEDDGENICPRFDTSLLEPLHIKTPLYSVNYEARDVAIKYFRKQGWAQSDSAFLRPFDPRTDTMFLPITRQDDFYWERNNKLGESYADYFELGLNRGFVDSPIPVLPRVALTPAGLQALEKYGLEWYCTEVVRVETIYVVDIPSTTASFTPSASSLTLSEIENASRFLLELEDAPAARIWWDSRVVWDKSSEKEAVAKLEMYAHLWLNSSAAFDVKFELAYLTMPGLAGS